MALPHNMVLMAVRAMVRLKALAMALMATLAMAIKVTQATALMVTMATAHMATLATAHMATLATAHMATLAMAIKVMQATALTVILVMALVTNRAMVKATVDNMAPSLRHMDTANHTVPTPLTATGIQAINNTAMELVGVPVSVLVAMAMVQQVSVPKALLLKTSVLQS